MNTTDRTDDEHDPTRGSDFVVADSLRDAPQLGPYCPITGARLRPWWSTLLYVAFHVWSGVAIFVGANHLHTHLFGAEAPGRTAPIVLWTSIAIAVYVTGFFFARLGFAARFALAVGAVWALVNAVGVDEPLVFADEKASWTLALDAERARYDAFLREAGFPPALLIFAALYTGAALILAGIGLRAVVRSWNLPRKLWFARYHPVWRRRYSPDESAHPVAGVLFVRDDEVLTDKLIWLVSERRDACFRFAPPTLAADPPAIPLGGLATAVTLVRDRHHWSVRGSLPTGPDAPARLRLLFGALPSAIAEGNEAPTDLVVAEDPTNFPVLDVFASDAGCIAKHYDGARPAELFGLLLDSRPASSGDTPHCMVLLLADDRVRIEYPHTDLLGTAHFEDGRAILPWRGADGEPIALELDGRRDSVHWIESAAGGYHLLFVAFQGER